MTVGMGPAFWQIRDEGDPYADDVIAHLWFDNDYTDRSQFAATYTTSDGATLSSGQTKFGAATSLDTSYVTAPDINAAEVGGSGSHLSPGDTEFTYEYWVYVPSVWTTTYNTYHWEWKNNSNGHNIRLYSPDFATNSITFDVRTSSPGTATFTKDAWHHIAMTRQNGTDYTLWIDGVSVLTQTTSTLNMGTHNSGSYAMWIASGSSYGGSLRAYWSNVRFTKKCRYTASFSVPTAPFPDPVP
jgi:Concanavalin A-like lectin/glucanases superfamily